MGNWKVGAGGVPRTNATTLTDDEVVLCDFLFAARVVEGLLLHPDQGEAFNLPYHHRVEPGEMPSFLQVMKERGLVEESRVGSKKLFGLTGTGGELWERERLPVWDAYCSARRRPVEGTETLLIRAAHRHVA